MRNHLCSNKHLLQILKENPKPKFKFECVHRIFGQIPLEIRIQLQTLQSGFYPFNFWVLVPFVRINDCGSKVSEALTNQLVLSEELLKDNLRCNAHILDGICKKLTKLDSLATVVDNHLKINKHFTESTKSTSLLLQQQQQDGR